MPRAHDRRLFCLIKCLENWYKVEQQAGRNSFGIHNIPSSSSLAQPFFTYRGRYTFVSVIYTRLAEEHFYILFENSIRHI